MLTKTSKSYYTEQILNKLEQSKSALKKQFMIENRINTCYLDDLLNEEDVLKIYHAFPDKKNLLQLKDLREHKYVGIQLDKYDPLLEEIIYAFQDTRIVNLIAEITGLEQLMPDEYLYAGGVSLMDYGCFLNPHLDNSHDKDISNYRVLNLLYYVTPNWQENYGGNLELWDQDLKQPCRTIHSKFNRLVIMVTNKTSWHSVSPINYHGQRCCVSNYYFSPKPADVHKYYHVTSFRGRPEQNLRDIVLRGDASLRNMVRKIFKHGIKKPHFYKNRVLNNTINKCG
ncbi:MULTISPECIES: 2OG-Fe(II) oxygenase [unclassified Nodularia (in: cyanobacteria)]|uniref:2OG-Fe(II) oxygenase n=1 Tax=unclassified Nodularia (in: cyanobacteria) TaxID=2656917 RepID=UPI001882E4B0|nr:MULTISPECIES: 2OG-Fe(II) oxygenase [unclassified Nodularia (in: cyanobacteria)]MBE9199638.1 2OG-Fe(II) oxygenase [Nodularia sp. LEGE 06071]MCC2692253.1 2OG-Fe(II) oxygenase [Nodularia sp. LEGE 04288]